MDDKKIKRPEENKVEKKEEIAHLKLTITELENQVRRILADYQNLEKRVVQERQVLIFNSNKHLLLRLMPVLDTLMLAFTHTKDKGLELAIKQFMDLLTAEGVKRIETKGKKFDPELMECVAVETGEEGKVISEVLAGYLLNSDVLRPAMVKVGSAGQNKKDIEKKEESDKIVN
jgi:molecular chaperone GrpE